MKDICEIHTVTSGPYNHNHAYPTCRTWSNDGERIYIESQEPISGVDENAGHIDSVDVETGETRCLAKPCGGCYGFDYAPGANCIAYIGDQGHGLYLVNLNTMESALVYEEPEGTICGPPAISHDGTRIAYWAIMPSIANRFFDNYITVIFALDVDPANCEPITPSWIVEAYPRRKLRDWDQNPRLGIHVNHPQINPANKDHICYSHEMLGAEPDGTVAMCRLWQTMANGDRNCYLVRQKAGLHFTHEVIAPDGKSMIFPYMHGVGQVFFDSLESRSIYYNPNCCPGHLTVSPDMKWVAGDTWGDVRDEQGSPIQSIMMFDMESLKCANLCWIPRSKGHPGHPHPIFSPDGGKIAFTQMVNGYNQVAYIDVAEAVSSWDDVAQGVGEETSPTW